MREALLVAGHPEESREAAAESLVISRRLAVANPGDAILQRSFCETVVSLGDLDAAQGRLEDARRAFTEGLEIHRRLAALDPANVEWQREVSILLERLGDLDAAQG